MPRVSVILTCFEHLKFLPAAFDSILSQTYKDYELIAIDDGSTDGSREWLSEHRGEAKLIFNERNLGTYASLNRALKEATGEFIAILNDDDLWAPEKLEKQVVLMDGNQEVGLVHTGGGFIDGDGTPTPGEPLGFAFPRFETGDILLALAYENKIIASAALARRQCFEELGGFEPAYFGSGDWQMWFRIAERWQAGFVDEQLTSYRVHGANASHKLERIWRDDERLREWIAERLEQVKPGRFPHSDLIRAKAHNWAALGTVLTLNGEPRKGRDAYRRSLELLPGRVKSRVRLLATYLPPRLFRRLL